MIGSGWTDPNERPRTALARPRNGRPRIAVVTGTRAEFGLLRPVMEAVRDRGDAELLVIAAGAHLIQPATTFHEVKRHFDVADSIPMQVAGRVGRIEDVEALGKGIGRFGRSFSRLGVDWVVVLGDRIEAFAAASAAAVGGFALAHIHGGDRAEGVADEAMRHAITKLANLHFPATPQAAERIVRMGERPERVHAVGSPAIDGLRGLGPLDDAAFEELGRPECVFLMHPIGGSDEQEEHAAAAALEAVAGLRVLALHPNHDPGRTGVLRAIENAARPGLVVREHLPREAFAALLLRVAGEGGFLIGNSSAGMIEAGALRCPAVDVGPRQSAREHGTNVVRTPGGDAGAIAAAIAGARRLDRSGITHPFGDGRAGERIAEILASTPPHRGMTRKLNAY